VFGVTLAAPPDRRVTARVSVPGQAAQTVELGNRGRRVSLPLTLSPGTTRIRIGSSGPSQTQRPDVALPYDLLVEDPVVTDAQIAALGSPPQSKLSSNAGSPFVD
jgi:hypothetical protein